MPSTISAYQFFKAFPSEAAAIDYIETVRWPGGVACPYCGDLDTTRLKARPFHQCRGCRHKFTVRTGTIFERSHIPLDKWLYAMYLLQTARKGVSSIRLAKELGITQKSAWFMLHRLREACGMNPVSLGGVVEVDETYIGGRERNKHARKRLRAGRGSVGKQAIVGLRQRDGAVVATPVASTTRKALEQLIVDTVAPGSTVYTDEHASYTGLGQLYRHGVVNHGARQYVDGDVHTNSIESVWGVLKRSYRGIYHQWSFKHSARYVNECTFRLNLARTTTLEWLQAMVKGASGRRLTYRALVASHVGAWPAA